MNEVNKNKEEKTNFTVQKLEINGRDGGECQMRTEIAGYCCGCCGFPGDGGRCDSHGGRRDHRGHQSKWDENGEDSGHSRQYHVCGKTR
uniref:Uncharacterized protein n=1 Tax=Romanomermis culicivorax TaxID=13658 RepID=A0A915JA05_ROMCU